MRLPDFTMETLLQHQSIDPIAGIDEAGMGALAGPVVAAAVIIIDLKKTEGLGIRDSKTLSPRKREEIAHLIKAISVWAIGEASVQEITKHNIRRASHLAMRRAVDSLSLKPKLLIIDGLPAQPHPHIPAQNVVAGDSTCISIAAASILAKVHRDFIMERLGKQFPQYKFERNKGYPTQEHKRALLQHGLCFHHRPTYTPVRETLQRSSNRKMAHSPIS